MDAAFIVLLVVGGLAVAGAIGYVLHQMQARRATALAALAAQWGFQFDPSRDGTHDERFGHFSVFAKGHSRYAYNTLRGAFELDGVRWPVQLGDYHYQTTSHNGKRTTTQTHRFSYAIVETPFLGAPQLAIRAENFLHKLVGALGFDDIDFESAEFSRKFHVKSPDKRFAYSVIDPRMMEFLLDATPPSVDFRRGQCCLTQGVGCWSPEEFAAVLEWSKSFFTRWPRHVTTSLESPP